MPRLADHFDPKSVRWHHVTDPDFEDFKLDYEYSILGYDLASGRLDMLLRFAGNGGHCMRHRHVASTATFVLEGEQRLQQLKPDGTTETIRRKAGEYALSGGDEVPHLERGGPEGCTVLLSLHAPDGILFEYMDRHLENRWTVTIEEYVERWARGGAPPAG